MKAIIFDMDGVIFDTERLWKDAFEIANKIYDVDLTEAYRQTICGKSEELIREELKVLMPNLDVTPYRDYMVDYVNDHVRNGIFNLKDGFVELIKVLKEKNYKIALATSSTKARAMMLFGQRGLNPDEIFDSFIFAEDVGVNSKPNPYIFLASAERLGVKPEDAYVVEDSLNGIVAAHRGGFKPIMVIDLIQPDEFSKKNCYRIFNNLDELKNLIQEGE